MLLRVHAIVPIPDPVQARLHRHNHFSIRFNTLRTGLLNCLNARSRGLTFRAPCVLYIGTGVSLLSRERFLYI